MNNTSGTVCDQLSKEPSGIKMWVSCLKPQLFLPFYADHPSPFRIVLFSFSTLITDVQCQAGVMDLVATCVKSWQIFKKMDRDCGCSDALSMSKEMSASKQTNNRAHHELLISAELMKWKTEKTGAGAQSFLSIRKRRSYWRALLKGG